MEQTIERLQTVREFLRDRDWPTETSIRWYIHRNINGFDEKCIVRVGKRVLINPMAFDQWIRENSR